ncbi:MAG: hypothetical protein HOE90_20495 [Bacteriovoracaceae bacterium]|nr:hypothetical protein [Bacteriovoracaceae bacterium]
MRLLKALCLFVFSISAFATPSYRAGESTQLTFGADTETFTNAGFGQRSKGGIGGKRPEDMGPHGASEEYENWGVINERDQDSDFTSWKEDLSPSEKQYLYSLNINSIIDKYIDWDFLSQQGTTVSDGDSGAEDTEGVALSERAFEILYSDLSGKERRAKYESFITLNPISTQTLGAFKGYLDDEDTDYFDYMDSNEEELLEIYNESYYQQHGVYPRDHFTKEQIVESISDILLTLETIVDPESWEGYCQEFAALNSNPKFQDLFRPFKEDKRGRIYLCEAPISYNEVEDAMTLLYGSIELTEKDPMGRGRELSPPSSVVQNNNYSASRLAITRSSSERGGSFYERLYDKEKKLSSFLYTQYYDRMGINPHGIDFCDYDKRVDEYKFGASKDDKDPFPIVNLNVDGEIWNHVLLGVDRRVSEGNNLNDLVLRFRRARYVKDIRTDSGKKVFSSFVKSVVALCEDSDFKREFMNSGGDWNGICRDGVLRVRPKPLLNHISRSGAGIYECSELSMECFGKHTPECKRQYAACEEESEGICSEGCYMDRCLPRTSLGEEDICYNGRPDSDGSMGIEHFARAIEKKSELMEVFALDLLKGIFDSKMTKKKSSFLAKFSVNEVVLDSQFLNTGDPSVSDRRKKLKSEEHSGNVLLKDDQPLGCSWNNVWQKTGTGEEQKYSGSVPGSIYTMELPHCPAEDNLAFKLLDKVKGCETLSQVVRSFTRLVLALSTNASIDGNYDAEVEIEYLSSLIGKQTPGVDPAGFIRAAHEMVGSSWDP